MAKWRILPTPGSAARALLACVVLLGVATSCGGDEGPPAVIEVVGVWAGGEQEQFRRVLDLFEDDGNIDVRYTQIPSDTFRKNLLDRIESGNPPDVALLPQSGLLSELARIGYLVPIEDVAGPLVDRNYAPMWRQLGSERGTLYGVWFKAAHKSLMWYRPSAFAEAGVTPPRSWSDLQAVAPRLMKPDVSPLSVGGGDGWVLTDWFENVYLRTAGADKYDQLACHQIAWTDDSVKYALATLGQVLRSDWIAGGKTGSLATTFPKSVEQVFGDSPSAAMLAGGDFVAGALPPGKVVGVDFRFFDFPAVEGTRSAVVAGGDVGVVLKMDSAAGKSLVRFLATPEAAVPWARAGGFISPNQALDLAVYPDDSSLSVARSLRETDLLRYDLSDQQPASFGGAGGQGMWRVLQEFLRDPTQVDRIAGELEAGARVADVRCLR